MSEELYDFKKDRDGLVNLINYPKFEAVKQRFKKLLSVQVKRGEDLLFKKYKHKNEVLIRTSKQ